MFDPQNPLDLISAVRDWSDFIPDTAQIQVLHTELEVGVTVGLAVIGTLVLRIPGK